MNDYKLNGRYKFFTAFLLLFVYPIIKAMVSIAANRIKDESGEPLTLGWRIALGVVIFLFGSLYIWVAFSMLLRLIKNRGAAFTVSENGIENTSTFVIVLAFILYGRVKRIPWEAIQSCSTDKDGYTLKVDTSKIKASKIAKLHMKLAGYNFCRGFTEPLSQEDFDRYIKPYIHC